MLQLSLKLFLVIRFRYLRDHFSPTISAWPIHSSREYTADAFHLIFYGTEEASFSVMAPPFGTAFPSPEIQIVPSLLDFQKVLKSEAWV